MECLEEGCIGSARKKGYCERHYRQHRIKGDIGWDGTVCLEDDCEKPAVSKGRCHYHYGVSHRAEIAASGTCSIEDCDAPLFSGGWCQRHYARNQRWADPLAWKKPIRQSCTFEGCERKQAAQGFCDMHYRRLAKYGHPELPPPPIYIDPPPLVCPQCGGDVPARVGKGRQRTYCSDKCAEAFNYWKKQARKLRNQLRPYGLTVEQYQHLLADQDGRCAICRSSEPGGRGGWNIDHDHSCCPDKSSCGECIRGLLCWSCNLMLGNASDDPIRLRAAAEYVEAASS